MSLGGDGRAFRLGIGPAPRAPASAEEWSDLPAIAVKALKESGAFVLARAGEKVDAAEPFLAGDDVGARGVHVITHHVVKREVERGAIAARIAMKMKPDVGIFRPGQIAGEGDEAVDVRIAWRGGIRRGDAEVAPAGFVCEAGLGDGLADVEFQLNGRPIFDAGEDVVVPSRGRREFSGFETL